MSDKELSELRDEVARLQDALESERRTAEQWRRIAEDRRVTLENLRQRRIVRWAFSAAKILLPPLRRLAKRFKRFERWLRSIAAGVLGARHRLTSERRERRLRREVAALPPPARDERSVTAVILTRNGREHLERLLPALRQVEHDQLEIVVVDNASSEDTRSFLERQSDIRVLRNERNESYAEANNAGAALADSDLLLFLNDDVEPLDAGWLGRMLAALHDDVVAVGAQLVYPRRSLLAGRTRDVGVQHLGIELVPRNDGVPAAVNIGDGADPDPTRPAEEVAAATGACLLVERDAFEAAGGFDTRYVYGAEDVDLCWRLRRAGGRIVVCPDAVLFHHEGATRHRESDSDELKRRQNRNWGLLASRYGPELRRAVELDRLRAEHRLSRRPYTVAITITRDLPSAGYGDWYTAKELGHEFTQLGWNVRYIERYRDAWYDLKEDVDTVIALHDTFDVRRVARPGLTTIAWVRNWTDRWLSHPWFEDLDVVLASSTTSAEMIREGSRHDPDVMPLATNTGRFRPGSDERDGVVLAANYWGEPRGIAELIRAAPQIRLYGKGWDEVPEVADSWNGVLDYEDLPRLYRAAEVVVDQTAGPTRRFGAVNSRAFDALAAGALVLTDQVEGARELFGERLPTYEGPEDLAEQLHRWSSEPEAARSRAEELRGKVEEEHTYTDRAARFRDLLVERARRPSIIVKISAPDRREARTWGDTFFAEALIREFRASGHRADMQTMDEWEDIRGRAFDVSLHLKGRSRAPRYEGQVHLLWVISHPDELDPDEVEIADVVFVASRKLCEDLRTRTSTPVHYLPQATDHRRFRPRTPNPRHSHNVAFVGNSRFVERPAVKDALEAGLEPAIYGANWEKFVDPRLVIATFIPNEELPVVYSSVKVLLNDHWEDMRRWGIVSNRIFDALACGACIVSDPVAEVDELFGDAVATYRDPDELDSIVEGLLTDPARRRHMGEVGRRRVVARHTFEHRASELLEHVDTLHGPVAGYVVDG